ncbi:MAG: Stp1/IreP family PP2C-type Ser/Thr phosphatase [Bacillota bacterium]
MKVAAVTDPGKMRTRNEDSCGSKDNIFVVADGMGGHQAGEIASSTAVDQILLGYRPDMTDDEIKDLLIRTNHEILRLARSDTQFNGMGTTLSLMVLKNGSYHLWHVGDSRIYVFKGRRLLQLTSDHSVVGELMRQGSITENEAMLHPQRNVLTRALGTDRELKIETGEGPAAPGDVFMLCTDGLSGVVAHAEMENILNTDSSLGKKAEKLVELANKQGGPDNITVMLVMV